MPSTPTCHEIPHALIHSCCDTNWNPPSCEWNEASNQMDIPPVPTENNDAASFTYSGRRLLRTATSNEPRTGRRIRAERIGKEAVSCITAPP